MVWFAGLNGETPCLDQTTVESALDSLRSGKDLPMNHPLTQFVSILPPGSRFEAKARPIIQTRIFDHLVETIHQHLNHLRRMSNLPPVNRDEKETGLERDFNHDNEDLHAWSVLYHRYVRVDLGLSVKAIQDATNQGERTVYRRHGLGLFRLVHELNLREMRVRSQQQAALLRQKLPAPDSPFFIARDGEIAWARQHLNAPATRHILLTGTTGIGKTALARQLALRLIDDLAVQNVAWISEPIGVYAKLLEHVADRLGLPTSAAHAEALQAYAAQVECLIVLDQADGLLSNPDVLKALLTLFSRAYLILCSSWVPPMLPAIPTLGLQEFTRHEFDALVEQYAEHYPQLFQKLERIDDFYAQAGGNPGALRDALAPGRSHSAMEVSESRLSAVWETLPAEAQAAWLILAIYADEPIVQSQLSLILQVEDAPPQVGASVGEQSVMALWQRDVVRFEPAGDDTAVVLHRLARTFAERLIASTPDHIAAVYQAILRLATHLSAYPDALACARMLRAAARAELHSSVRLDLAYEFAALIERAGQWDAWSGYLLMLLDMAEGEDRVWTLTHLGLANRHLARSDEAAYYLIEAIEAAGTLGAFVPQADAQLELAILFANRGNLAAAEFLLSAAENTFRRQGQVARRQRVLLERAQLRSLPPPASETAQGASPFAVYLAAQVALQAGDLEEALRLAEGLHATLPTDDPNYPRSVALLGQVRYEMGDWVGAAEKLQWAIQAFEGLQDVDGTSRAKYNLAMLYLREGDPQAALNLLETLPIDFA